MTALITGGSSGMGLEYSRQLAAKGYDLLIVSNQQQQIDDACAELSSKYNVKVTGRYQNLASDTAADELYNWCKESGIVVDVLINNAGMFFWKELHPEELGRVDAIMKLHMTTPVRLTILFGEDMKQRRSGHILIVSSMAAKLPMPGITLYSATKAFLRSFGKSMYFELKPYNVGLTVICPAAIATPLYNLKENLMNFAVKIRVIRTPEWLVRRALKCMFAGRRCVSPDIMNVYLPPLIAILPHFLVNKIWKKYKK